MKTTPMVLAVFTILAGCKEDRVSTTTLTFAESPPSFNDDDKAFVAEVAQRGMLDLQLARIAKQRATSPAVQAFATQAVADRTEVNRDLRRLAAKKGYSVPTTLDRDHQATIDALEKLADREFDRLYASDMVAGHEADLRAFDDAAKRAKDPDLRAWVEHERRTLDGDLAMAKDLRVRTR